MNKHKRMKEIQIVPQGTVPLTNGEAASCGQAQLAQNVREKEQSLQVTGNPVTVGSINTDERLLLIVDGHYVTSSSNQVKIDGAVVAVADSDIINAHCIGSLIVIVTRNGFIYLKQDEGEWVVMDPEDALPQLTFHESYGESSATIDAYQFVEPYSQWQAPLADADVGALAGLLRTAWTNLHADAAAEGLYCAPMLVRWSVRLMDDTYLWMSEPVRVGDAALANADRISASVEANAEGFIGTQASLMTLSNYNLQIAVSRGISDEWLPLIKSVDVLVTDEAELLTSSRSLDYRCLTRTTNGREYVLEMGFSRRSAGAISAQLATSSWHIVATAPATAQLSGVDFTLPLTKESFTNAQCNDVGALGQVSELVCSTATGGRLYCATASGDIIVTVPGNALVEAHRRRVIGAQPLSIAVVTKPLYSGGFGRYPVYVFTGDGIFAIPQSATGLLGEARLVDRTVIATDVPPVEASRDIWFVSRHHHLCRLRGSQVDTVLRNVDYRAMAWCNAFQELWLLPSTGYPEVIMASGSLSTRTVDAVQLYSDPLHAVALTDTGLILDLEQESEAVLPVAWRSHPIKLEPLLSMSVRRVVWHIVGKELSLTLKVKGARGIMAQEQDVSTMMVTGDIDQPLAAAPMAIRARAISMEMSGMARSGTLVLPSLMYSL